MNAPASTRGGINLHRLGPLGVEARGVRFENGLDESQGQALYAALLEHGLVLVRDAGIADADFVDLGRRFGTIQNHRISRFSPPGFPEIHILSNATRDGEPLGNVDAGQFWHSDGSYLPEPYMYTMLHAVTVPRADDGTPLGSTCFASTTAACDALPETLKDRIAGLHAVHSYAFRYVQRLEQNAKAQSGGAERRPDVLHPIVRAHPITGRMALFLNEGYVVRVNELDDSESDELLRVLFAHGLEDRFCYTHVWQEGDLLFWDNNSAQHRAVQDYQPKVRTMKRINVRSARAAR